MEKIKIAIEGCGDIARIRYFYALEKLKDKFELVALHDNKKEKLEKISAEKGIPGYSDYDQMISIKELDTVIVATYHPSHADIAVRAMEAGKNVIIEKPFATSGNDARRIVETAKKMNVFCMPMPYEIYPIMTAAKKMIDGGAIGKVSSCDGIFAHRGPLHAPWFFSKDAAIWGVMADLGIYPLGILAYLIGSFNTVSGKVETLMPERISLEGKPIHCEVEDNAVAVLEWENGALGTVRTNWCTAADKNGSIYYITIYGTDGVLYLNMHTHELIIYSPKRTIKGAKKIEYLGFEESFLIDTPEYDNHIDILKSYFTGHNSKMLKDDPDLFSRQVNIIEAIEGLYLSSKKGEVMKI
ncbi:MAG: Gfo/Idh/MocA family oxidoreductase [Prevotella sp.]|jgi:predicted dehydrogenase|nr:Gfo/Idh/MocA family oxidoreductase [Prevotella sp.]